MSHTSLLCPTVFHKRLSAVFVLRLEAFDSEEQNWWERHGLKPPVGSVGRRGLSRETRLASLDHHLLGHPNPLDGDFHAQVTSPNRCIGTVEWSSCSQVSRVEIGKEIGSSKSKILVPNSFLLLLVRHLLLLAWHLFLISKNGACSTHQDIEIGECLPDQF